jgi:cobalamin biosynthetic protein CobC
VSVSANVIDPIDPLSDHGGNVSAARLLFPRAPEPWVDLSTGICPFPYPVPAFPQRVFTQLPDPVAHARLVEAATRAYRAPSSRHVVAAPGTQILLPLVCSLVRPGRAAILSPTYAEHARAALLAGHRIHEPEDLNGLERADIAIVVNPNNPDGHVRSRRDLIDLAAILAKRGGLLVVDEAFMDTLGDAESVVDVDIGNTIVLRSFGKFYGLAGVRLGFAIAAPSIIAAIAARLGPWAVSGIGIQVGEAALADEAWRSMNRARLKESAQRLDTMLVSHGIEIVGGTMLYRLVRSPRAAIFFQSLGENGILVRRFEHQTDWLRFGLPADEESWRRLDSALGGAIKA